MTDETNAVSAAVAPPELKSTDTRVHVVAEAKPEPAKVEAVEAKPEPVSKDPEGVENDAPAADSQRKQQRLPRWMQERLERERQVTEARTEARVREELSKQPPAPQVTQSVADPNNPYAGMSEEERNQRILEECDYDSLKAAVKVVRWEQEQEKRAEKAKEQESKLVEAKESFHKRVDSFEEKAGDGAWEDILKSPINNDAAYLPVVQAVLAGQDIMHADEETLLVLHELATNPDEAKRLSELPISQRLREVAKLAERFSGQQQEKPAPALPKKTTNAPPPPKTVSGSGKPSVDVNAPDLTPEQRIAMWRKKG
jgi:hypothetical protein